MCHLCARVQQVVWQGLKGNRYLNLPLPVPPLPRDCEEVVEEKVRAHALKHVPLVRQEWWHWGTGNELCSAMGGMPGRQQRLRACLSFIIQQAKTWLVKEWQRCGGHATNPVSCPLSMGGRCHT